MAIAPISSVSFRNNYNQINFEGKKEKKSSGLHVSSSIKAIPLATMIALSPLNNVEADGQVRTSSAQHRTEMVQSKSVDWINRADVVEYKDFEYNGFDVRVNLVKDRQNPGSNKIWFEWEYGNDIGGRGYISRMNHVKYNIKDEQGNPVDNVMFDAFYVHDAEGDEHSHSFSNPDVCNYVNKLIKNNRTNVKDKNVVVTLIPRSLGFLGEDSPNTDWIERVRYNNPQLGSKIIGSWEIDTDNGKYKVEALDNDGELNNFEQIAIHKKDSDEPVLQVKELVGGLARFQTIDNDIKDIDLYQINLKRGKGSGSYAICNKQLWNFIVNLYGHQKNNNSIEGYDGHYRYDVLESGLPISTEIR